MISYILQHTIDLQPYNTFWFHCLARDFVELHTISQAQAFFSEQNTQNSQMLFLWWWSNILLTEASFDGIVVKNNILWKNSEKKWNKIYITVWWWENRHDFVMYSVQAWRAWLEHLALIPWTVWAAPIQNIGAYWVEAKDSIESVTYIDTITGEKKTLTASECSFGYRDSIFKNELAWKAYVVEVCFRLTIADKTYTPDLSYAWLTSDKKEKEWLITPLIVAQRVIEVRQSKLPDWTHLWTAGSFFKNPLLSTEKATEIQKNFPELKVFDVWDWLFKLSAGQLLDLCWYKWYKKQHVWTYEKHALVLVHHGWWTWEDIVALCKELQQWVYEKFNVMLEPEVRFI